MSKVYRWLIAFLVHSLKPFEQNNNCGITKLKKFMGNNIVGIKDFSFQNVGSEWRKWDLHVHTPFSYLDNQFGDDFDNYVKKLFKKAIEKEIAVIGITDYFCIEGYKKIKTEYLTNEEKLKELFSAEEIERIKNIRLFPNIEFRLDTLVGGNRVNFHVIFSDSMQIRDIEENFLGPVTIWGTEILSKMSSNTGEAISRLSGLLALRDYVPNSP